MGMGEGGDSMDQATQDEEGMGGEGAPSVASEGVGDRAPALSCAGAYVRHRRCTHWSTWGTRASWSANSGAVVAANSVASCVTNDVARCNRDIWQNH